VINAAPSGLKITSMFDADFLSLFTIHNNHFQGQFRFVRALCNVYLVLAWERCRISPPRFLVECLERRLNWHIGSFVFVLLCFALFAFSGLC